MLSPPPQVVYGRVLHCILRKTGLQTWPLALFFLLKKALFLRLDTMDHL